MQPGQQAGSGFQNSSNSYALTDIYYHGFSSDATILVSPEFPIFSELIVVIFIAQLPQQQYKLFKTPLNLAFSAYNSKVSSVTHYFYYRFVISMIRCNFSQSLKRIMSRLFRATLTVRNFVVFKIFLDYFILPQVLPLGLQMKRTTFT